ncbi:MAG: 5-formyltetrahydrofolate cyclo-ligase [Bacteroidales bacterium]|nr:5-formyltetrahydrofolate cyclo-ligase [Bacteroidales bacterium]MBN2748326.1 5-formyltetrahydrofolate cyclo-ligase [Bacteroidales bacterium]
MTIVEEKKELRRLIRQRKKELPNEVRLLQSEAVFKLLEQEPAFVEASCVMAYWSLSDELETHRFVEKWYKTKKVLLPLVVGSNLELRQYTGPDSMVVGPSYGILEPANGPVASLSEVDFVVVPGVAFDLQLNRMGRGGGYYDKTLAETRAFKAGVCLGIQVVDKVPTEPFDIKVDKLFYTQS